MSNKRAPTAKELIEQGYTVVDDSKDSITLKEPKKLNWIALIVLSIFFNGFGFFGYLIYHSIKKQNAKIVTLSK